MKINLVISVFFAAAFAMAHAGSINKAEHPLHRPEKVNSVPMNERNYSADEIEMADRQELVREFIVAVVDDRQKASKMLTAHPDLLEAKWIHGETVLHFLAIECYVQDDRLLAKMVANEVPDSRDFVIHPEKLKGIRFLAEMGANVNALDEFGNPPIINVSMGGSDRVAEILLAYGANPNAESETYGPALHLAVGSGNARLVEVLLKAGAKPKLADYKTIFDELPDDPEKRAAILAVLTAYEIHEEDWDD